MKRTYERTNMFSTNERSFIKDNNVTLGRAKWWGNLAFVWVLNKQSCVIASTPICKVLPRFYNDVICWKIFPNMINLCRDEVIWHECHSHTNSNCQNTQQYTSKMISCNNMKLSTINWIFNNLQTSTISSKNLSN